MKILGLDLGSSSIGWAVVSCDDEKSSILGLGSRIIPYEGTEGKDFEKGTGESRNSLRTTARGARRGYDRYQLRRKLLIELLIKKDMCPSEVEKSICKDDLWKLRSRAVNEKVSLRELGRLFLWLNQKRGYKSGRSEANIDKKDTELVSSIKNRHQEINELNITIGQYFAKKLEGDSFFRIKDNIFPREAYIEEFDAICKEQQKHYLELNDKFIETIRNSVIYYQRPLKSQKSLVSMCEFESKEYVGKDNKTYVSGPKVAPKSSPLFQVEKIWETINNITLSNKNGNDITLSLEQKKALFEHLDNNDKLTLTDLFEIVGYEKDDCVVNSQLKKGLEGNRTKVAILKCFGDKVNEYENLFKLDLDVIKYSDNMAYLYDKKSRELLGEKPMLVVESKVEKEPYYKLWHTIYAIKDKGECFNALTKMKIEESIADKLVALDFSTSGYGNKSVKVFRKILPYLMQGDNYYKAMSYAGYNHSNSLNKDENLSRALESELSILPKNSLRQPIVEKILNQMINVVNAVIIKYGRPDEIRIELARELKQSKDERKSSEKYMGEREKVNKQIASLLKTDYGLNATRRNIIKWRLYEEMQGGNKKLNAFCIYCGQPISKTDAIIGSGVDVEHIIPKSKLFDDSQNNKTLAHRHCNRDKNDQTAYDFMNGKSEKEFNDYILRVNSLYTNHIITKSKRDKLLMSEDEIPQDFIDRQLRESQYIAKKAHQILQKICHNVWATSGSVTSELRRLWGWDDVTMNLQFDKYKQLGLTSFVEWESDNGRNKHQKEVITGFSKRDDHRHHAVDALVIACTKQGYIQKMNTLSSSKTNQSIKDELSRSAKEYKTKLSLLEKYIVSKQPISTAKVSEAVDSIFVSFKSGKKVTTLTKRKVKVKGVKTVVQDKLLTPRGALHEETVYGEIKVLDRNKPLKYLFNYPDLIYKQYIRELVENRLSKCDNDSKKALSSLKKEPIYLDKDKNIELTYATCYKNEYVVKYKVDVNFNKVDKVIDNGVRDILQGRLNKFNNNYKLAFKDVSVSENVSVKWWEDESLKQPIISVRCRTGLSSVVSAKKNDDGSDIGFVKPGNNHHIAIYRDRNGVQCEHIVTFWHAVERKRYGLPVVIKDSGAAWDLIMNNEQLPESFLNNLPDPTWTFEMSMQQNEMFIVGMNEELYVEAINSNDRSLLSKYLYRVQKISKLNYVLRHHLETKTDDKYDGEKNEMLSKNIGKLISIRSLGVMNSYNLHKVKINLLGDLVDD